MKISLIEDAISNVGKQEESAHHFETLDLLYKR